MKDFGKLLAVLAKTIWIACFLFGGILLFIGVNAPIHIHTYTIGNAPSPLESWIGVVLIALGAIDALSLIDQRRKESTAGAGWNPGNVSGKILQPRPFQKYPENAPFSGTLTMELPENSHLWLLRRFQEKGPLLVDAEMTVDKTEWHGTGHVGGQSSHTRWFEVWVVGDVTHRHFQQIKKNTKALGDRCGELGISGAQFFELKSSISANTEVGDAKLIDKTVIQRE